jgi:hypothetical protein
VSKKSLGIQLTNNSAHDMGKQNSIPELPEENRASRNIKGRTSQASVKEVDLLAQTYGSGEKY